VRTTCQSDQQPHHTSGYIVVCVKFSKFGHGVRRSPSPRRRQGRALPARGLHGARRGGSPTLASQGATSLAQRRDAAQPRWPSRRGAAPGRARSDAQRAVKAEGSRRVTAGNFLKRAGNIAGRLRNYRRSTDAR
jgi:hypothetical protein